MFCLFFFLPMASYGYSFVLFYYINKNSHCLVYAGAYRKNYGIYICIHKGTGANMYMLVRNVERRGLRPRDRCVVGPAVHHSLFGGRHLGRAPRPLAAESRTKVSYLTGKSPFNPFNYQHNLFIPLNQKTE